MPLKAITRHGTNIFDHINYDLLLFVINIGILFSLNTHTMCTVGETAVFECKVSSANMNIQWLKDNKPLSGDNFRTCKNNDICCLELSNVSHDDAGLYTIVASNAKESTSSSSTLNVLSGIVVFIFVFFCSFHSQCHIQSLIITFFQHHLLFVALDSRPTSPGGSFLPHAPKFKVKLKDTELLEGTTVRFEVIVRGLPIPNISM